MIAWMRSVLFPKGTISRTAKWLLILTSCMMMLALLAACQGHNIGMLNPKGIVAYEQRKLFFDTLALMLIVVLPVIVMSFTFVYHYQASHHVKDYKPNWSHSYFLETLWWGIPCVIIVILAVITWKKTHELDPYNRIPGHAEAPMVIQVIALPWKWLFIYPQQNIATVNYLVIPVGQQIEYWITADNVPMSAFFIPQLGSQIYAMAGMRTRLHLLANQTGTFDGMNTQYNGDGFSDMHYVVTAIPPDKMNVRLSQVQQSANALTQTNYLQLLNPSIGNPPKFFAGIEPGLFENVIATYMNSNGTAHPRSNQMKFYNSLTPQGE